jgi:hypothetical protein
VIKEERTVKAGIFAMAASIRAIQLWLGFQVRAKSVALRKMTSPIQPCFPIPFQQLSTQVVAAISTGILSASPARTRGAQT